MNEEFPLVSVICLSYNHEKYIEQALGSIIHQTYPNFEIILFDNNSSDQSFEIAKRLLENSKIKFHAEKSPSNLGIAKALNVAISKLVNGKYISLMSMDDWLETDSIIERMNYFKSKPECGAVYSSGRFYYEDTGKFVTVKDEYQKEGMIFQELLKNNFVFTYGIIIKKEVYDTVGLYDENLTVEDWDFSLRAAKKFPFGVVRKPLFNYRRHSSNYSASSKNYYRNVISIIDKYKGETGYKEGFNWINNVYIGFLFKTEPEFSSLLYILRYYKWNKEYSDKVLSYSKKLIKKVFRLKRIPTKRDL